MTGSRKPTCFICKYELTQKKFRIVNYKDFPRKVCFHCTPSTHKICKMKYSSAKVDCGICTKPVLYNKCLKCDICDHMIHGSCNDLNKDDIKLIEKTGSFTCLKCTQSIFPFSHDILTNNEKRPKMKTTEQLQCFLCTNPLNKRLKYSKNTIIYNEKSEHLCLDCSLKEVLPFKDQSLVEYLECTVCDKKVKYEGILCDLCQHWSHPDCYGLNRQDLASLNVNQSDWFCGKCVQENLPILSLQDGETVTHKTDTFKTYAECSVCSKEVKNVQSINCSLCHHWVHSKCLSIFNTSSFKAFNATYENQDWFCPPCLAETLPFIELNDEDFYLTCLEVSKMQISHQVSLRLFVLNYKT